MKPLALLHQHHTDSVIAYLDGQAITAGRFLAHATSLAATLPAREKVINLCDDRYYFLLSFVAALLRGQLTLLPPNRSHQTIAQLVTEEEACYLLSDRAADYAEFSCHDAKSAPPETIEESIPAIDAAQAAVRLYTSGSSGVATPHLKTWGMLTRSAQLTGEQLGVTAGTTFVATVPPQHMFGLEMTVLLPMQCGCAIDNRHPLFPADIRAALGSVRAPRALITTPLQLRACASEQQPLAPCEFILSATAPLSAQLAGAIELLCNTTVQEIYGSTETGAIATRATAKEEAWTLLAGYVLQPASNGWQLHAPHFLSPQPITDRLAIEGSHFRLLGRNSDLIKVAGKRVSLGELNHILLSIEGVDDGVFFLPDEGDATLTTRLAAAVVSSRLSNGELLKALRANIDPAFLPRPLLRPARLPRNTTGKLPRQALLQLLDEELNKK